MKEVVNNNWQKYRSHYFSQNSNWTSQQSQQLNLSSNNSEDSDDSLDIKEYMKMLYSSKPTQKVDTFAEYTSSPLEQQFEMVQW